MGDTIRFKDKLTPVDATLFMAPYEECSDDRRRRHHDCGLLRGRLGLLCFLLSGTMPLTPMAGAKTAPAAAEYAIRWDVTDGGPQTAEATVAALKRTADESDTYEVSYFTLTPPDDAPSGFKSILRQRVKGKKHELTFKYRGARALSKWRCPLSATPDEAKNEVDVSITDCPQPKRAYSYSCTLESKDEPPPPPADLHAQLKPCPSKMTRLKAGKLKIEEWRLPAGAVMIEVSRNGSDTPKDLKQFRTEVADPLIKAGIQPSDRSKSELGGECK